ncbi:MAG: hypothetical protein ACR2G3_11580 [Solirubrobacterales bacterium]
MYDTLLFLHLLGAFVSFVTVGVFVAWGFGAPVQRGGFQLADWAWNVSGALLLVFGVWLALYVDGYELWDGWILGALVLFGAATAFGAWARRDVLAVLGEDGSGDITGTRAALWNWLRTASIVAILVLMVWKPGA